MQCSHSPIAQGITAAVGGTELGKHAAMRRVYNFHACTSIFHGHIIEWVHAACARALRDSTAAIQPGVAASAATAAAAATPAIRRPPGFIPGDYQYCNRATLLIFPSEPLCCVCCMHTNGKRRPSASASTARCCPRPAPA
jgi:hypothetical protein